MHQMFSMPSVNITINQSIDGTKIRNQKVTVAFGIEIKGQGFTVYW